MLAQYLTMVLAMTPAAWQPAGDGERVVDVGIWRDDIPIAAGGSVTVPVRIDAHGLPVCAASIDVWYDTDLLDVSPGGCVAGDVWSAGGIGAEEWEFLCSVRDDWGRVRLIWYTAWAAETATGVLAEITFEATGAAAGDSVALEVAPLIGYEGGLWWVGHAGGLVVCEAGELPIAGDANADGRVDYVDLGVLATNYGSALAGWADGDFTHDGIVDWRDLGLAATSYGGGPAPGVPGPATLAMLIAGTLIALTCRSRRWAHQGR